MMDLDTNINRLRRCSSEDEEKKANILQARLMKLGFSNKRSLKSLTASGFHSEQLAAQWLASHVDDPDLDKDIPREYSVFLCPEGDIVTAIQDYWCQSRKIVGWNMAHQYLPHITILPPFEVTDSSALILHKLITDVVNGLCDRPMPQSIPLQFYSNKETNFIGYVVPGHAKSVLEGLTNRLLADLQKEKIGLSPEVLAKRKGIYHISLAYGYPATWHSELIRLQELHLPPSVLQSEIKWEIRLFSKDARISNNERETYEMKTTVETTRDLRYKKGDYITLLGSCQQVRHGWAQGFNTSSGLTGAFPLASAERVPHWYSWVHHRNWDFGNSLPPSPATAINTEPTFTIDRMRNPSNGVRETEKNRKLFVFRHAERMDMCFGRGWISRCFDQKGVYKRVNLCMPSWLPARPHQDFAHDSPLTQTGHLISKEMGRALLASGVEFTACYSSPSLRCIQTAAQILIGSGHRDMAIRVEAHLFEWLGWYSNQLPKFMTPSELQKAGFPIDLVYKPYTTTKEYNLAETPEKYYDRASKVTRKILDSHKKKGSVILIIAHAGSLDTCTRHLVSKLPPPSTIKEFQSQSGRVPYCGLAVAEERPGKTPHSTKWYLIDPPVPPITTHNNMSPMDFEWKFNP